MARAILRISKILLTQLVFYSLRFRVHTKILSKYTRTMRKKKKGKSVQKNSISFSIIIHTVKEASKLTQIVYSKNHAKLPFALFRSHIHSHRFSSIPSMFFHLKKHELYNRYININPCRHDDHIRANITYISNIHIKFTHLNSVRVSLQIFV